MDSDKPRLGHALLGYKRRDVVSLLAGRDRVLQQIAHRHRAAEEKLLTALQERDAAIQSNAQKDRTVADLQEQVGQLNELVARLEEENREATSQLSSAFIGEELTSMLNAAESSAARILDGVRSLSDRQLGMAERAWSDVQDEIARLTSWREQLDPVVSSVRSQLDETVLRLEDAPRRMRDIVEPIAHAMTTINEDLQRLAQASKPPLVLTANPHRGTDPERRPDGAPGTRDYPRVSRR